MSFSRDTLIHLVDLIVRRTGTHAGLDTLLIRFGLEDVAPSSVGGLEKRAAALLKHLVQSPDARGPRGAELAFEMVEHALGEVHQSLSRRFFGSRSLDDECPELVNSLRQDGFEVEDGKLVRSLPQELDLAEAKDEVHRLLERFAFATSTGHLEQAIAAHARGEWASANANLRTYFESLLDDIANHLWPQESATRGTSHERRELLAQGHGGAPPFLLTALNEWVIGNRGGFIRGAWDRLHPEGSHPGLSDEEDSTFRIHLVLLTSRHLLRRLDRRST